MRQWLIAARRDNGLTQKDMAKILNVSQPSYWAYEHGSARPSPETAKKIASVLGFPWTRFYE